MEQLNVKLSCVSFHLKTRQSVQRSETINKNETNRQTDITYNQTNNKHTQIRAFRRIEKKSVITLQLFVNTRRRYNIRKTRKEQDRQLN